jgi:hypothetical protein
MRWKSSSGVISGVGFEGAEGDEGSGADVADTAGTGFASGDSARRVVSCGVCWRNLRSAMRR